MGRRTKGFRGYTPLPPHLAHLGGEGQGEGAWGPAPHGRTIRHPDTGIYYLPGYRPPTRTALAVYGLGKDDPARPEIHIVRFYELYQHLAEALAMLAAGATEEEIVAFEHTS